MKESLFRGEQIGKTLKTLGLAALLLSGCHLNSPNPTLSSTPVATPIVVSNSPTPSDTPAPEVADALGERKSKLQSISQLVKDMQSEFPGKSAIYFLDLESDLELGFSEEDKFESASLMKLVVAAELYRRIETGDLEETHSISLTRRHIVGGSGDIKNAELGTSYPIKELAEKMIIQSDNTATQMLTDLLSLEAIDEGARILGLPGTHVQRNIYDFAAIEAGKDNLTTAKDTGLLLKLMAREELPGSADIHGILERQERNDMIGSNPDEGLRIAHKTGELNSVLHDAGVIYSPGGSYVLVMLSQEVIDKKAAIEAFAKLHLDILAVYSKDQPETQVESTQSNETGG